MAKTPITQSKRCKLCVIFNRNSCEILALCKSIHSNRFYCIRYINAIYRTVFKGFLSNWGDSMGNFNSCHIHHIKCSFSYRSDITIFSWNCYSIGNVYCCIVFYFTTFNHIFHRFCICCDKNKGVILVVDNFIRCFVFRYSNNIIFVPWRCWLIFF